MQNEYIAVDWGSTHLRAWHIRHQTIVNRLQLPMGVTQWGTLTAAEVFSQHIAPWRNNAAVPVVMAGMIGSEAGWHPVPYVACPVRLASLRQQLCAVGDRVWIVPGLKVERAESCSVMRGEETQLLGAMQRLPSECYVMPGTHCKWVQVREGQVSHFETVMTGELHHLLQRYSLLGKGLPAQRPDEAAFSQGLEKGMRSPSLLPELLETRAAWVLNRLPRESVADYLSGLLIGAEVAAQCRLWQPASVTLVGSESLNERYRQAFARRGIEVSVCDGDEAFLQGVRSLLHAG
ncbi:2-dehydro-3-deoxygalactonokinase [Citrobacter rodentium]|uniref:2-oxo-3-deoxygalactonate kinase n=2 Tax=Citrobacter rodentium TaxID=67825 RepID=D2TR49_CITRI|nr:2-dehydro-3-deoxygalactonokinase [Citrobacter rodentium]KIQ50833.1 2-oxo-3-deoxygalactonate kinase [Citrobacter rodentium]QBY32106.1 2-dehydro-3-deoxygalactonokinase [Citrobacter rodentium]UHO33369.1 2-dehydro-3-deoxygalactonokinase [Citrobacter rodentium NBRC 105723 = DSM 16636]CBG91529.1 putative 2-oxo-3-deoxygalactonate kinase [Citrobacter rodentium ICC168]HAT8013234.1 2-oxo-3-deoxygalactonate kinase [Citrobacter rodentium NBRC 105723 = DSM 16636]